MTTRSDGVKGGSALVLSGGGVAGIAWEIGVLARLAELGIDLPAGADLVIGTSAGSTAGALFCSSSDYAGIVAGQRVTGGQDQERMPAFDMDLMVEIFGLMAKVRQGSPDAAELRRRVGALALGAATPSEAERRQIVAARLLSEAWPAQPLLITAVEVLSGERVVFDAASGVSLVDAVAASCAVPGIWPPVTIGGQRYMDGGVYSASNSDLAAGHQQIVTLCPVAAAADPARPEAAGAIGGAPLTIVVDAEAEAAFGPNLLDPASRGPALAAGMRQADEVVEMVRDYWAGAAVSTPE
jgi:NTE family protein